MNRTLAREAALWRLNLAKLAQEAGPSEGAAGDTKMRKT